MDFRIKNNIYVVVSFLFSAIIMGLIFVSPISFVKTTKADMVQTSVIVTVATPTPTPTPAPQPSPAGGGAVSVFQPQPTKVILIGKAYPGSVITILQDGKVITSSPADPQANFKVEISDITPGVWSFTLWGEDRAGRKSISFSFSTVVTSGVTTTVSGIFLPPTIELEKTELQRGETLNILGQTAPKSEVTIQVGSPEIIKKTKAEADGTYFYAFDTTVLEEGSHTAKSKATSPDELLSTFSQTLAFYLGEKIEACPRKADINGDKKINLVDFSILLYNWGVPKNPAADLSCDGKVNLTDFSIMMYWWTG